MKPVMKEEVKIDEENLDFNFGEGMDRDFHDFEVNSPMFIPWNEDERRERFDMS